MKPQRKSIILLLTLTAAVLSSITSASQNTVLKSENFKHYIDTFEGKLIDAKGVTARYVRLYSNGSSSDEFNRYVEVEVHALPAK